MASFVRIVVSTLAGFTLLVLTLVIIGSCPDRSTHAGAARSQSKPEPPAIEPPPQRELAFAEVLAAARPAMGDSEGSVSAGAAAFALWLDTHAFASWADVTPSKDETSYAKIKKDSRAEIGKRMCVRGRVLQISRVASSVTLFEGTLSLPTMRYVHFISAGSTGDIVERSRARLCGVATGVYAYTNVMGGETQSVQMVGIFDLPENRP
jgi:hypothetical protein